MRYLLLLLSVCCTGIHASEPASIFVLHSYSQEYPWTKGQHQGFVEMLQHDPARSYAFNVEYLDTKRIEYSPRYADLIARNLREKYRGYRPTAIYVTDDNALSFARSRLNRIFPDVPVFFSGVNNLEVEPHLDPARFTGVFERKEITPNLQLMLRIDPKVRNILIVGDGSGTDRAIEREIREDLTGHPQVRATFLSSNRIDQLVAELRNHRERFVFLSTVGAITNQQGRTLTLPETIGAIVNAGDFVVFSMEDAYLYPGILGGYVTSGPRQGRAAALLLQRYLNGTPLTDLPPVEASPNTYIINEAELQKAGLTLPAEIAAHTTLIDTVPSFYGAHRTVIVSSLYGLATLLLFTLVASLFLYIRKSRQIALASQRLTGIKESLDQAQRIAQMGNWDWWIPENRLFWSDGIYRLFGIDPAQFGASYEAFVERVHPEDRESINEAVRLALEEKEHYDIDHRIVRPDGTIRIVHETAEIVRDEQDKPLRMIGTVQDVTEQRRVEQALREKDAHLEHIAFHDTLTGLPNRTLLVNRLDHAALRADRVGTQMALLFIDLDRFKTINDSLGHAVGDALLQSVAKRLKKLIREEDTVARFGGDEFVILLEEVRGGEDAALVAEKIIRILEPIFVVRGYRLHISGSIGISLYPQDGHDAETLVKNADAAMYKAKERGRNTLQFYSKNLTERVMHRMRLESQLHSAFANRGLTLFYQPLVCLKTRRIDGVEALLRWKDPQEGNIPPDQFIPLAEDTGLIIPLGEWVIREACLALKRWEQASVLPDDFTMHINLSGKQLMQKGLPDRLREILEQTGVSPNLIILELTESSVMKGEARRVMALRGTGVRIAIDDFGTGHSSLSRLKHLPISKLKIDRNFIQHLPKDQDDQAIVRAILALAASLGLEVIAEGIEQVDQEEFLLQSGCPSGQGFFYAHPMPEHQLLPLLEGEKPLPVGDEILEKEA